MKTKKGRKGTAREKKESLVKVDEVKVEPEITIPSVPSIIKVDEVKSEPDKSFSFSILYPNLMGQGKVEDITKDETKDLNASIMKEVVSLDKKDEELDDTITLDNFFTDVQKMTDPMSPIKEETKYTLFEDAKEKES